MIRVKSINFFARAINSLFGTPSINTLGELQKFLEEHPPLDTICELICRDDPQWMLSCLNKPIHFSRTKLTITADNWLRFISARLLATTHTFEVTRAHVVMIFAILTDFPFNIGRFLHKSIWKSAMEGLTVGLYHSSLIIALCARVDLERQPGDELLQPDSMLVQPRQRQPPASGLEEWLDRLVDEMNIPMSSHPHYPPDEPVELSPTDMGGE
ncbi:hypothetical protein CDL12_06759 [Handroanthus impetiginosus]|uniref:Putative plant transposon protein domain-containing protein n=1 Tax=Handroanthus impetiginosus TaxID=429701 RepID=A0A2G9HSR3_9LAMI|nr:hypothetical protein CDL12_06759 [Handroanthus impetiginosus]